MGEIARSELTGKNYDISNVVRLVNIKQSILYMKNGCKPLDIYVSVDNNSNDSVLVFIFDKLESKKYYDLWCKHELE